MIDLQLGDARELAQQLGTGTVQTIVTSPPYWGLRAYGTTPLIFPNGHELCDEHDWSIGKRTATGQSYGANAASTLTTGTTQKRREEVQKEIGMNIPVVSDICAKCGAWRGELGLEPTPEMYVAHLVELFRELRRALKDDGTLWLNLGDSFAGGKGQSGSRGAEFQEGRNERGESMNRGYQTLGGAKLTKPTDDREASRAMGLKPKDLVGIPWRVAFALQADGWYLRSDIIWHKPNPMPESVTDRPTKSHEYIFLLSKSAKYYYDKQSILEPAIYGEAHANKATSWGPNGKKAKNGVGKSNIDDYAFVGDNHTSSKMADGSYGRNRRSVWTVTTRPFKGAHFATFPEALIEPCILAGSRVGDIVLDPFNGAGTTGVVAKKHGRRYIGFELNPEYLGMAERRIMETPTALPLADGLRVP